MPQRKSTLSGASGASTVVSTAPKLNFVLLRNNFTLDRQFIVLE